MEGDLMKVLVQNIVRYLKKLVSHHLPFDKFVSLKGCLVFDIDGLKQETLILEEIFTNVNVLSSKSFLLKSLSWQQFLNNENKTPSLSTSASCLTNEKLNTLNNQSLIKKIHTKGEMYTDYRLCKTPVLPMRKRVNGMSKAQQKRKRRIYARNSTFVLDKTHIPKSVFSSTTVSISRDATKNDMYTDLSNTSNRKRPADFPLPKGNPRTPHPTSKARPSENNEISNKEKANRIYSTTETVVIDPKKDNLEKDIDKDLPETYATKNSSLSLFSSSECSIGSTLPNYLVGHESDDILRYESQINWTDTTNKPVSTSLDSLKINSEKDCSLVPEGGYSKEKEYWDKIKNSRNAAELPKYGFAGLPPKHSANYTVHEVCAFPPKDDNSNKVMICPKKSESSTSTYSKKRARILNWFKKLKKHDEDG